MTALPPLESLPPGTRHRLRKRLLAALSDLGITPQMDAATGELIVPLAEIAAKLGLTEDQVRETVGTDLRAVAADQVKPLQ